MNCCREEHPSAPITVVDNLCSSLLQVFGLVAGILFSYDTYTIFSEIKSTRGRSAVSTGLDCLL